ncbi:HupE/UreJ family protein [Rhodoferax mekongensis]|uniref:HupE/UreJ family protein n=1 Tax=Rhodoferax mekongensis TaxID=3068341 RepID=UPI0028BD75D6|nr:HupE/UreJ family protein [Rhodoferax sp. TBRC 17199]MDT7514595.1 HupE/UreJ family protein [Rhodoferax sp. TBRC 17199]
MSKSLKSALLFIAAGALSTGASAHMGTDLHSHGSFMTGLLHPLGGMDHLLAMLAVGVWSAVSARRAGPALLWGPLAFANMLVLGALLGLQGMGGAVVEPMVAASVLALGLLVLTRQGMNAAASMVLVGGFAVFHGLAHGAELAATGDAVAAVAGMFITTIALHLSGVALGWSLRAANVWATRATGAAVAASGLALLMQLA